MYTKVCLTYVGIRSDANKNPIRQPWISSVKVYCDNYFDSNKLFDRLFKSFEPLTLVAGWILGLALHQMAQKARFSFSFNCTIVHVTDNWKLLKELILVFKSNCTGMKEF